jgi:hypothetical protein
MFWSTPRTQQYRRLIISSKIAKTGTSESGARGLCVVIFGSGAELADVVQDTRLSLLCGDVTGRGIVALRRRDSSPRRASVGPLTATTRRAIGRPTIDLRKRLWDRARKIAPSSERSGSDVKMPMRWFSIR